MVDAGRVTHQLEHPSPQLLERWAVWGVRTSKDKGLRRGTGARAK